MATILNICKEAREKIRVVEVKLDEAIVAYKILDDGSKRVIVSYTDKISEVRELMSELKGSLKDIDAQLEKDSTVRTYYNQVYDRYIQFLETAKLS